MCFMRGSFEKWSSYFDEREVDRYLYLMSNFAVIPASRQVLVTVSVCTETFQRNISRRQNSVSPVPQIELIWLANPSQTVSVENTSAYHFCTFTILLVLLMRTYAV